MKTQLRTRSVKNLAVCAIVAATLNIAAFAQPRPQNTEISDYEVRLDRFIERSELSLKYIAPDDITIENEKEQALNKLEMMADKIEDGLVYKVPVEFEDQSVQNLELLANTIMDDLKYRAPGTNPESVNAMNEKSLISEIKKHNKPVKVEVYRSPQDAWLINAGYYKSNREPAWSKVKKAFVKENAKQLASEF